MEEIQNRSRRKRSKEFQKILNQEDLLAEISERVVLELRAANLSEEWLADILKKDSSYVDGLVHGFANITVRELADVFSAFDKLISLNLLNSNRSLTPRLGSSKVAGKVVLTDGKPEFDRVTIIFERKTQKYVANLVFLDVSDVVEKNNSNVDTLNQNLWEISTDFTKMDLNFNLTAFIKDNPDERFCLAS